MNYKLPSKLKGYTTKVAAALVADYITIKTTPFHTNIYCQLAEEAYTASRGNAWQCLANCSLLCSLPTWCSPIKSTYFPSALIKGQPSHHTFNHYASIFSPYCWLFHKYIFTVALSLPNNSNIFFVTAIILPRLHTNVNVSNKDILFYYFYESIYTFPYKHKIVLPSWW